MQFVNGKVVLTEAEKARNAEYTVKREALIHLGVAFANSLYGDRNAPSFETEDERKIRDGRWNNAFSKKMDELAKTIVYGD